MSINAGWSSLEARRAHNPKVVGSNPTPAILKKLLVLIDQKLFLGDCGTGSWSPLPLAILYT